MGLQSPPHTDSEDIVTGLILYGDQIFLNQMPPMVYFFCLLQIFSVFHLGIMNILVVNGNKWEN